MDIFYMGSLEKTFTITQLCSRTFLCEHLFHYVHDLEYDSQAMPICVVTFVGGSLVVDLVYQFCDILLVG